MADEKTFRRIASKPTHSASAVTSTYDYSKRNYAPDVRVLEKRATPVIPQEYREFKKLFKEELGQEALPEHQEWDCEMKLEPGKKPGF
jgi:hypothetical protein